MRHRHDNPHAEKRIRELGLRGWQSQAERDASAEAIEAERAAVAAELRAETERRIAALREIAADADAAPGEREYARRAALALEVPTSLTVAEYAFQQLVADPRAYAAWAHETREAWKAARFGVDTATRAPALRGWPLP